MLQILTGALFIGLRFMTAFIADNFKKHKDKRKSMRFCVFGHPLYSRIPY